MSQNTYIYPRGPFMFEDNRSYSTYLDLPIKRDCGNTIPPGVNPELCNWNCNLCPADNCYRQPVLKTDKIYLQYKFPINSGGWNTGPGSLITGSIVDEQGTDIETDITVFASDYMVGATEDGVQFQNIVLNVNTIPITEGCFIFKVTAGGVDYYTEPYQIVCNQNTMELEGTYTSKDFQNNIYSESDGPTYGTSNFKHRAIHRFYGTYEKDDIEITKKLNDSGLVTSIKREDNYTYRFRAMPPYEAEILGIIVGGLEFFADGVQMNNVSGVKKNNQVNRMWTPVLTSTKLPDDPNNDPASICS